MKCKIALLYLNVSIEKNSSQVISVVLSKLAKTDSESEQSVKIKARFIQGNIVT